MSGLGALFSCGRKTLTESATCRRELPRPTPGPSPLSSAVLATKSEPVLLTDLERLDCVALGLHLCLQSGCSVWACFCQCVQALSHGAVGANTPILGDIDAGASTYTERWATAPRRDPKMLPGTRHRAERGNARHGSSNATRVMRVCACFAERLRLGCSIHVASRSSGRPKCAAMKRRAVAAFAGRSRGMSGAAVFLATLARQRLTRACETSDVRSVPKAGRRSQPRGQP